MLLATFYLKSRMAAGAPLPWKLSPWKWPGRKQWRAFLEPEDGARREEDGEKKKNNRVRHRKS
jgi:hypothetical protein